MTGEAAQRNGAAGTDEPDPEGAPTKEARGRLAGKVAIVTGAGSTPGPGVGTGRATAIVRRENLPSDRRISLNATNMRAAHLRGLASLQGVVGQTPGLASYVSTRRQGGSKTQLKGPDRQRGGGHR